MQDSNPAYDIKALKEANGDELFANVIKLPAEQGSDEFEIVWKPPTHGTYRIFQQAAEKRGNEAANRQLLLAVAVYPDRKELLQIAERSPLAVSQFLDQAGVTNFFGLDATISVTRKL